KVVAGLCALVIVGSATSGQHGQSGSGSGHSNNSSHSGNRTAHYSPGPGPGAKGSSSGSPSSTKMSKASGTKSSSGGNEPWQHKQLGQQQRQHIERFMFQQQGKLNPQQQGAFNQLLSGGELSFENRNALTDLLASQTSELSPELRQSISDGLKDDEENRRAVG